MAEIIAHLFTKQKKSIIVENKTGRSVAANMLALGASDPGFESRRPDHD